MAISVLNNLAPVSIRFPDTPVDSLVFYQPSGQMRVYTNDPENVLSGQTAEYGKYLNKQDIPADIEFLLFTSLVNSTGSDTRYAVRVYNPGTSDVTVTQVAYGFAANTDWALSVTAWQGYWATSTTPTKITVPARRSIWLINEAVANGAFVENNAKYSTDGALQLAVYFAKDPASVPDSTSALTGISHSGWCDNFWMSTSFTHTASELLGRDASYQNSAFYRVGEPSTGKHTNEENYIHALDGSDTGPNNGNYGLQYHFTHNFVNDLSRDVTFRGYVYSNPLSHCAGIASGGIASGFFLGSQGSGAGYGNDQWNFFEQVVTPGQTWTDTWHYCHLSKGNAPGMLRFEAV